MKFDQQTVWQHCFQMTNALTAHSMISLRNKSKTWRTWMVIKMASACRSIAVLQRYQVLKIQIARYVFHKANRCWDATFKSTDDPFLLIIHRIIVVSKEWSLSFPYSPQERCKIMLPKFHNICKNYADFIAGVGPSLHTSLFAQPLDLQGHAEIYGCQGSRQVELADLVTCISDVQKLATNVECDLIQAHNTMKVHPMAPPASSRCDHSLHYSPWALSPICRRWKWIDVRSTTECSILKLTEVGALTKKPPHSVSIYFHLQVDMCTSFQ